MNPTTTTHQRKKRRMVQKNYTGQTNFPFQFHADGFLKTLLSQNNLTEILQNRLRENKYPKYFPVSNRSSCHSLAAISENRLIGCNSETFETETLLELIDLSSSTRKRLDTEIWPKKVIIPEKEPNLFFVSGCKGFELRDTETLCPIFQNLRAATKTDSDISFQGNIILLSYEESSMNKIALLDPRTGPIPSQNYTIMSENSSISSKMHVRILGGFGNFCLLTNHNHAHILDFRSTKLISFPLQGPVDPARWCPSRSEMLPANPKHPDSIIHVTSLPDEHFFLTSSKLDGYRLWEAQTGTCVEHFKSADGFFEPFTVRSSSTSSFYGYSSTRDSVVEWSCKESKRELNVFERPRYWPKEVCGTILRDTFDALIACDLVGSVLKWD